MSTDDSDYSDIENDYDTHRTKPAIAKRFKSPGGRNHEKLMKMFAINPQDEQTFLTLLCLCDPKTQPSESNDYVLSVQYLSQVLIGIQYCKIIPQVQLEQEYHDIPIETVKYKMSLQLFTILLQILPFLSANSVADIESVVFDANDWEQKLPLWGPYVLLSKDLFNLRTTYWMVCILLNSLNELFSAANGRRNLALNPYCFKFTQLWKIYTEVLRRALTIDQIMEDQDLETPLIIIEILKGSSMVRFILGSILNQSIHMENDKYITDLQLKSLLEVYLPNNRSNPNGGSLNRVIHFYELYLVVLDLELNSDYQQIFEEKYLTFDSIDEDVRYIFDFEDDLLEEENDDELDQSESEDREKDSSAMNLQLPKNGLKDGDLHKIKVKLKDAFIHESSGDLQESDEDDWNDNALGQNIISLPWFKQEVLVQFANELKTKRNFDFLLQSSDIKKCITLILAGQANLFDIPFLQKVINRIAIAYYIRKVFKFQDPVIQDLVEFLFLDADESLVESIISKNLIIPIFSVKNFELLFVVYPEFCKAIFLELFLTSGARRFLIWKICHVTNLSYNFIDFICQLLIGFPLNQSSIKNTRSGMILELNDTEKLMLLNEFIESSLTFLSAAEGLDNHEGYELILPQSVCNKFVHLICMLISKLIEVKVITFDWTTKDNINSYGMEDDDSKIIAIHSIVGFLFQFISKVPSARKLYFEVLNLMKNDDAKPIDGASLVESTKNTDDIDMGKIVKHIVEVLCWEVNYEIKGLISKVSGSPLEAIAQFIDNFPKISDQSLLMYTILKDLPKLNREQYIDELGKPSFRYKLIDIKEQLHDEKKKKAKKKKKK